MLTFSPGDVKNIVENILSRIEIRYVSDSSSNWHIIKLDLLRLYVWIKHDTVAGLLKIDISKGKYNAVKWAKFRLDNDTSVNNFLNDFTKFAQTIKNAAS